MVVASYAVAGALQILVWNPLAAVPGASLDEIYRDVAQANESLAVPLVVTWAAVGIALAVLVLVGALRRPRSQVVGVAAADLMLVVFAAPAYWIVSFPAGMGIADAFSTSGGDHAPWGVVLYSVSVLALMALIVILVRYANRSGRNGLAGVQ